MDWIALGYLGLFLAAFLAATILPVASEALFLLMLFSFNPWICLFVATAGNTLGGFLNYGIGYLAKPNWLKKVGVTSEQIEKWKEKEAEYAELFANPYNAAARGYIDEVIKPEQTREKLIRAFKMLENKAKSLPKKKHGNIPL